MKNYLLAFLTFLSLSVHAKNSKEIDPSAVVLKGIYTGTKIQNKETLEITLLVSEYPFTLTSLLESKALKIIKKIRYNESFEFNITSPADHFYVYINYKGLPWTPIFSVFMVQKGDRINCELSKGSLLFTGKGSEKLQCQSEILKRNHKMSRLEQSLLTTGQIDEYFKTKKTIKDSILNIQKRIFIDYSAKLGPDMTEIMQANCLGLSYIGDLWDLRGHLAGIDRYKLYEPFIKSDTYRSINFNLINQLKPKNIIASPVYIDFILTKLLVDQIIFYKRDKAKISSPEYKNAIFAKIKNDFTGLIRDKLMTVFLLNSSTYPKLNDLLDQADDLLSSSAYKKIISDLRKKNLSGVPFYPFELKDTNGKTVKLSNFDDYVVYVDFWFTGCTGCIKHKTAMKPVLDKFKNNQKVIFLSISIDANKEKWLKSVASGEYADPDGVNLYTGGLGSNHPLIKHYNINSYPTYFLLKNGKIFSSPIPRPGFDQNGKPTISGPTGELISLIQSALTSNQTNF